MVLLRLSQAWLWIQSSDVPGEERGAGDELLCSGAQTLRHGCSRENPV